MKISKYLPQIIASLFLAGFVAYAWTEPASPPPSGNVDAPVNIGSVSQYKSGALGIGGVLRGYADAIFDGNVGIGTTNPQGLLDVGGGKFVVATEGATNFTAGPNNSATVINDGDETWLSPDNAKASDNFYASGNAGVGYFNCGGDDRCTTYLKATGFAFSIPAGAVIDGIKAEIEKKGAAAPTYNYPMDYEVKIIKNGTIQGVNHPAGFWPASDTYVSHGGPTDKWGLSWAPADINNSNFGVAISVELDGSDPDGWGTAYVDHIRITVYYHTGGTDVAKVGSSVTIKGDGSVSTNLNADKLDGLDSTDFGRQGLYGHCSNTYFGWVGGNDYCASAYTPAYVNSPGTQSACSDAPPACLCPAGYVNVQTGGPNSAFPPQTWFFSCYKQ